MYIVATISKNSYPAEKVEEIVLAGATILRYNFSHGTPDELMEKIAVARRIIKKHHVQNKVKILADLPGNKIRLGAFPEGDYHVEVGTEVLFQSAPSSPSAARFVPVDFKDTGSFVKKGQVVTLADGEIGFVVTRVLSADRFRARALNSWHIPALKGMNIGRAIDTLDHFTNKTLEHVAHLKRINPDWVAFSFVGSAAQLERGKQLLADHGMRPKIVAKLETPGALANLSEIVRACDIVMVARGDLGLNVPLETLGISQKRIVAAAKRAHKPVIVATQILDSLLSYYVPSRAEILDLTNIVLDGADGIMLTKETGISKTPGRSVEVAVNIIRTVKTVKRNRK